MEEVNKVDFKTDSDIGLNISKYYKGLIRMKKFVIKKNDSEKRLDKFVLKAASGLSPSLMYKYIRKKAIKVNGKRAEISYKLCEGDIVEMYINDEFFAEKSHSFLYITYDPKLTVIYEDENLLLIDKKAGVIVHDDNKEGRDTLINQVLLYLYKKGEYDPHNETSFVPSLCNRLDKNTGGIVIVAKNAESQRLLYDIIKHRQVKKKYLALIHGIPEKKNAVLYGFLKKDETSNTVEVRDEYFDGSREIRTGYNVIKTKDNISLVEVDLITGRTHQIRAHFAHIGNCVVGDCKYGTLRMNKGLPYRHQALYSYSLEFLLPVDNKLSYLNGKIFKVDEVYFLDFMYNDKKVSNID